jgi:replicative DNA helicase
MNIRPTLPKTSPTLLAQMTILAHVIADNDFAREVNDDIENASVALIGVFEDRRLYDIFNGIELILAEGKPATLATVSAAYHYANGVVVTDIYEQIATMSPTIAEARACLSSLIEHRRRAEVVTTLGEIADYAKNPELALADTLEEAQYNLEQLAVGMIATESQDDDAFEYVLPSVLTRYDERAARGDGLAGLSYGIPSLDRITAGMTPGQLIVIGARPRMGKSVLGMQIAEAVARAKLTNEDHMKRGVALFISLEMEREDLGERFIIQHAKINKDRMTRGTLYPEERERLVAAVAAQKSLPLHTVYKPGAKLSQIAAAAKRLKRTKGLSVLVVDYLGLMTPEKTTGNTTADVTAITKGLKILAGQLGVPLVLLCQLNRKLEDRENKRPQLADLRDSGSIEQDADVVIFVHREEEFLRQSEPDDDAKPADKAAWNAKWAKAEGKAELIVAKQRRGKARTAYLAFYGALSRFAEFDDADAAALAADQDGEQESD